MNIHQMITRSPLCLLGLLGLTLLASPVAAQVLGPGPSDPNLFDNVISLPPDTVFGNQSIGGDGLTTQVNVSDGGSIGVFFQAFSGAEVNMSSGSIAGGFMAQSGSEVNISGGSVGSSFEAKSGSVVNISDGTFAGFFDARSGSEVNITGGNLGNDFDAFSGSVVNISGGTFTEDCTNLGCGFDALPGSEVNISGGSLGILFGTDSGSVVNITGGSFGAGFTARGEVNISGGSFGVPTSIFSRTGFVATFTSVVNISGGTFDNGFRASTSTVTNLFGSEFVLNGVPLDNLTIDEAFQIVIENGYYNGEFNGGFLSGVLADGSTFGFDLSDFVNGYSDPATLTVTLVSPEPDTILGDANQNGEVNFFDIAPFIDILSNGSFLDQADCNQDGVVDFFDIAPFIEILTNNN